MQNEQVYLEKQISSVFTLCFEYILLCFNFIIGKGHLKAKKRKYDEKIEFAAF